jgi:hypothetical protein
VNESPCALLAGHRRGQNGPTTWEFELPAPNALVRNQGLQRDFIKVGDQLTVMMWRAKYAVRSPSRLWVAGKIHMDV